LKTVWYQVEFYSNLTKCWVPLFARGKTEADVREALEQVVRGRRRIVKVTQITEVVSEE
jgi:hypothetical protein